jgi:hypothetical protein
MREAVQRCIGGQDDRINRRRCAAIAVEILPIEFLIKIVCTGKVQLDRGDQFLLRLIVFFAGAECEGSENGEQEVESKLFVHKKNVLSEKMC